MSIHLEQRERDFGPQQRLALRVMMSAIEAGDVDWVYFGDADDGLSLHRCCIATGVSEHFFRERFPVMVDEHIHNLQQPGQMGRKKKLNRPWFINSLVVAREVALLELERRRNGNGGRR